MRFQKACLVLSAVLGITSVFTPIIYHISPNYLYQFWSWGFTLYFGLSSSEIGVSYNSEVEFLLPALFSIILILICSIFLLIFILKGFREKELKIRLPTIAGIIMIATPAILMISWHLLYTIGRGYPVFWGSYGGYNYYLPSYSFVFQFSAGGLALLSSLIIKMRRSQ